MSISLCIICHNEKELILRCLDCAGWVFDQLCLVRAIGDEAPDNTVELAREWCASHGKDFRFSDYKNQSKGFAHTDHFAAARQLSFDIATGDWCLWLDCDDVISPENALKIRELSENPAPAAYLFAYDKPDGSTCTRERLIRRGRGHWENRVHEFCRVLDPQVERPDIAIKHQPVNIDRSHSHERNLALLRLETSAMPRNLFYYHEELCWLFMQGQQDYRAEAIRTGQAALQLFGETGPEERYEIMLNLGELEPAIAEEWFLAALRLQPWRREALAYLAQRAVSRGDRSHALSWFRLMDSLPRPSPLPWTHREVWYGWARNYLRVGILRLCGDFERAEAEHAENMKSAAYARGAAKQEACAELVKNYGRRRVIVQCPTRERAARCRTMIESFLATRLGNTTLHCYVADDDPQLPAYRDLAKEVSSHPVLFEFGPRKTIVEVFNRAADMEAEYFGEINDDHIYRTIGWDVKLIAALESIGGRGMASPKIENLPSGVIISADCVRALGWFQPPGFRHQYVDNAVNDLYGALDWMVQAPDVFIEHCHPAFGKVPMDATYTPMMAAHNGDAEEYRRWKIEDLPKAVEKLKSLASA